jgi:hypothetical protein
MKLAGLVDGEKGIMKQWKLLKEGISKGGGKLGIDNVVAYSNKRCTTHNTYIVY